MHLVRIPEILTASLSTKFGGGKETFSQSLNALSVRLNVAEPYQINQISHI